MPAPAPAEVLHRWAPVAIVVALIVAIVGGAQVFARPVAADTSGTLVVGADVRLQPAPGWDIEPVTTTSPAARLHRGAVVLDVTVSEPAVAGPAALAHRYVAERLQPRLSQLAAATPDAVILASGVPAVRVWYVGFTPDGLAIDGVITAVTGQRASAIFDASAPSGELVNVAEDVQAMVDHAVVP